MKKLVMLILTILSLGKEVKAQGVDVVYNLELVKLIQENYLMRNASNSLQQNEYSDINKNYDNIKENIAQVLFVKDRIYKSLRNVEQGMRQGKQVQRITRYSILAMEEFSELVSANFIRSPDVILLRNDYVTRYKQDVISLMTELSEEVLKINDTYLVSYHDRQKALNRIQSRVYQIYVRTKGFNIMLKQYRNTHILHRQPQLSHYITRDKMLFNQILRRIDRLQTW